MNKIYIKDYFPYYKDETLFNYFRKIIKKVKNNKDRIKIVFYCFNLAKNFFNKKLSKFISEIDSIFCFYFENNKLTKIKKTQISSLINSINNILCDVNYNNIDYLLWDVLHALYSIKYSYAHIIYSIIDLHNNKIISTDNLYQYINILLRTTKQFNIQNSYSNHIKEIIKQDIDKLELVDYNMLLDIANEHYNIDISEFNYDNIFSRRNLIELIRREYQS